MDAAIKETTLENLLKYFVILIFGLLLGMILMTFDIQFLTSAKLDTSKIEIGFPEFASIALTAATVALGSVALVVGVAAVFGYAAIRDGANKRAEDTANNRLDEILDGKVASSITEIIGKAGKGGALDEAFNKVLAKNLYGSSVDELDELNDKNE